MLMLALSSDGLMGAPKSGGFKGVVLKGCLMILLTAKWKQSPALAASC